MSALIDLFAVLFYGVMAAPQLGRDAVEEMEAQEAAERGSV